jgi:hypothetical protein
LKLTLYPVYIKRGCDAFKNIGIICRDDFIDVFFSEEGRDDRGVRVKDDD